MIACETQVAFKTPKYTSERFIVDVSRCGMLESEVREYLGKREPVPRGPSEEVVSSFALVYGVTKENVRKVWRKCGCDLEKMRIKFAILLLNAMNQGKEASKS